MKSLMAVNTLGVVLVNDERATQLRKLAILAKRQLTRKKRQENIEKAPNPPLLLSLNELQKKTGLNYSFLRKMIVEEKQIPCLKVGNKFVVNYDLFLAVLGGKQNGK